jgi:hypothetical protein
MLGLLLPLVGFALLDALNVLNLGVTSAIVLDSRLRRRSALPAGLSFVLGVFAATTTFGVVTVLGVGVVTARGGLHVTPEVRFWGQLALGLVLLAVALLPGSKSPEPPSWARTLTGRRPWLFAVVGLALGFGQAVTSVPYLTSLAMLSSAQPLPALWPLIVLGYCALALLPSLTVLFLSTRRTPTARRVQRAIVRVTTRYGPVAVRILFGVLGAVLVTGALLLRYR